MKVYPNNISLVDCRINLKGVEWNFTDDNTEGDDNVSYWGNGVSKGECGVRIKHYNSAAHSGKWRFFIDAVNVSNSGQELMQVDTAGKILKF